VGLILIRHTTPAVKTGVCYGRADLDVAASFESEADALFEKLPYAELIVSSPLQRCLKLAERLSAALSLSTTVDPRIAEMDFGAWEELPWSEIPREELDAWAKDFMHARPHGGESVAMLRARTLDALAELRAARQPTLVVTHAGVIKAALSTGDSADHFRTEIGFGEFVVLPPHEEDQS